MQIKNRLIILFYVISCFYFISCSCTSVDCGAEETDLYFEIINRIDSTDLVFGDNKIFEIENLKVFELNGLDTTFFNINTVEEAIYNQIYLTFDYNDFTVSRIFLDFGNTDLDTLDLKFKSTDTECCGTFRELSTVDQNGIQVYDILFNGAITLMK